MNSIASLSSLAGDDQPEFSDQASSYRHRHSKEVVSQVKEWLQHEKAKRSARKAVKQDGQSMLTDAGDTTKSVFSKGHDEGSTHHKGRNRRARSPSARSDTSLALEELEEILAKDLKFSGNLGTTPKEERGSYFPRRRSTRRRTLRKSSTLASSDTDYQDGDALVPSAEVVLDNSKTLGYSGGTAVSQRDLLNPSKRNMREKEAWLSFKKVGLSSAFLFLERCATFLNR